MRDISNGDIVSLIFQQFEMLLYLLSDMDNKIVFRYNHNTFKWVSFINDNVNETVFLVLQLTVLNIMCRRHYNTLDVFVAE